MGNCMYTGHKNIPSFKKASPDHCCIQVLHSSDGRISKFYQQSLQAAELMLEFPNQFLVELQKGNHRPSPLSADTDLKPCQAYLLLPMHRMSTRISQEEIACFMSALSHQIADASPAPRSAQKSSKGSRRKPSLYGRRSRVAPLVQEDADDDDGDGDDRRDPSSDERSETSYVNIIQKSYSSGPAIPQEELLDAMLSAAASSSSSARGGGNHNHLLIRRGSRSWVPRLETISE